MKVKDYTKKMKKYEQVTFIRAIAVQDELKQFSDIHYLTTPVFCVEDIDGIESLKESIILNDKASPIEWLSGGHRPNTKCLLIISEEDFAKFVPSEKEREATIDYIDGKPITINAE